MKKIFSLLCAIMLGICLSACDNKTHTIAVSQFISHKALDDTYQGIVDGLKEAGHINGKDIHIVRENSQGNNLTATQIATKFRGLKPEVMVGIATPAAQALIHTSQKSNIPLLFGAVSDPVGAGLHEAKGVTDMISLPPLVRRIREVFTNASNIGVIYSAGESNSVAQVKAFKEAAMAENFEVLEKSILRSTDAQAAFDTLAQKADLIFTPTDNLIIAASNVLIGRSFVHKTPIITSNRDPVEKGALMGFGVNYYAQGKMIAGQIDALLKGKKMTDLKVLKQEKVDFFVNKKTADTMGIEISEDVMKKAKEVY